MDKFIIQGGVPLEGRIRVNGAKNAALPMMAAALLAGEGRLVLRNVPKLRDIDSMGAILEALGVSVARRGDRLTLEVLDDAPFTAPYELVSTMRASFCVLGPLVARRRRAKVSLPGGCVIGVRPVDLHLKGLRALGADIAIENGYVLAESPRLRGAQLYLGGSFGSTVTGTANVVMAAVLARGVTIVDYAACEPEVQDLCLLLNKMGARISGIGSPRLVIEGVESLHGADHTVLPDRIEAGTFIAAGALTGGDLLVEPVRPDYLGAVLETLRQIGVDLHVGASSVRVRGRRRYSAADITTLPYPGFPTDLQAQMMALLSLSDGISVIQEKIYPDRFMHVAELARLGANIRKEGASAVVIGVDRLHGAPVMASDLRASAALLVAGLAAEGVTEIRRVYHIDRGYDRVEERFCAVGARIDRVVDQKVRMMEDAA
jgi:UDP-N-acetylglucosamine 1-carboxyvinyltransferase